MKRTITSLILFFSVVSGAFAQISSENITITLQKGQFNLNKAKITPEWNIAPALKLLGNNDRLKNGYNITHSYDELGLVLFETANADKTPSGHMSEFQAYLSAPAETNTVMPSGLFRGSVIVENIKISRNSVLADLRKKLLAAGYTESDSYSPHNFRFAYAGVYMYILCDETETRVVKISMGKDKTKDVDQDKAGN